KRQRRSFPCQTLRVRIDVGAPKMYAAVPARRKNFGLAGHRWFPRERTDCALGDEIAHHLAVTRKKLNVRSLSDADLRPARAETSADSPAVGQVMLEYRFCRHRPGAQHSVLSARGDSRFVR